MKQRYNPDSPDADQYGYVTLTNVREVLEVNFIHCTNRDVLIDEAEREIQYLFDRQREEYEMIIDVLKQGIKKTLDN